MLIEYKESFKRDIENIQKAQLLNKIDNIIKSVKISNFIFQIPNIKKIKGYKNYYRIRIGDYQIGLKFDDKIVTFIRFLHRKDIYKYFP